MSCSGLRSKPRRGTGERVRYSASAQLALGALNRSLDVGGAIAVAVIHLIENGQCFLKPSDNHHQLPVGA